MPYEMHRIFCSAAGDLEEERQIFHKVIGSFNEQHAMKRNILLVSVSLPEAVVNKLGYQSVMYENIRDCRYYIQLLEDTWGPPQKNFEKEYALAKRCEADPAQLMQEAVVFFKKPLLPHKVEPEVAALKESFQSTHGSLLEFETGGQLAQLIEDRLIKWLDETKPAETAAAL